ncbi:MAG: peroxide stress protein YaaA [Actinomycetota bacterium]|nr:peroxide stress protein YaaA [Actinomycetota bacterium]MDP2289100.1 peroxide stress protein YaaA [Actinomycetota bacterium]
MLILLPPSESKSAPATELPAAVSFAELNPVRTRIMRALVKMCSGNQARASKALGLGRTQLDQLALNSQLATAACGPAIDIYTGVVFEALSADTLTPRQRERLHAHVLIASGLHGLVRPLDSIAPYRLSANSKITGLPGLASLWRAPIGTILHNSNGPILDLRSQAYVSLAPIPKESLSRSISVRVLQEQDGKRTVVSHFNKATKGLLVRDLVRRGAMATSTSALTQQLTELGYQWEMQEQSGAGMRLDIITHYTPGKVSTPRK